MNAAAAVAQSAIQQVQAAKEIKKQVGVYVVFVRLLTVLRGIQFWIIKLFCDAGGF